MRSSFFACLVAPALAFMLISCDNDSRDDLANDSRADAEQSPQDAFWERLQQHCGNAYEGELVTAPDGDEMLVGDERLVAHFRECSESEIRVPFHIEKADGWDRSRTWVYTRDGEGLELRHDHRHEDGTPEDDTWYGGRTQREGTPDQQEFVFTERTAPDGSLLGWRIQIHPQDRYVYGTFSVDDYTWRVDFDLSRTVDLPPAPWGHE
jgi:hypothetical protein